jgi:hypothetical protein
MICIILRNIDTESADYELLLFGYLKVILSGITKRKKFVNTNSRRLPAACGIVHLVS